MVVDNKVHYSTGFLAVDQIFVVQQFIDLLQNVGDPEPHMLHHETIKFTKAIILTVTSFKKCFEQTGKEKEVWIKNIQNINTADCDKLSDDASYS